MSIAFVSGTIAGSGTTPYSTVTTPAIDTTGANFLVLALSWNPQATTPTISDSKGNTWTALTKYASTSMGVRLFYCAAPTVGTGHTFTATNGGGGAIYPALAAQAYSGVHPSSPFVGQSGAFSASAASLQPGSLTPPGDGHLLVTGLNYGGGTTATVGGGFTASSSDYVGANHMAGAIGRLIQGTAAAVNPTWSWSGWTGECAATMAAFQPLGSSALGVSPGSVVAGSAGNTLTLTGTGTSWTAGTPGSPTFTASGGTITAQVVNSATSATLTFTAPGSAGTVTLTDPTTGATAPLTVTAAPVTIATTDANWSWSPYNWK